MISFVANASATYSASYEDNATVYVFCDFQEMGALPSVIENPEIERQVSMSFAHSESA